MFTVNLECPGTRGNYEIIKRDLDLNNGGLREIRNRGSCDLVVGALDSSRKHVKSITILPGGYISEFCPPKAAVVIYAVCDKYCQDDAILEYDDPDLIA